MKNYIYEYYGSSVKPTSVRLIGDDGKDLSIPLDESNADYQQYLVDTDGGLPLPKETK